jgi:hypothetical protein
MTARFLGLTNVKPLQRTEAHNVTQSSQASLPKPDGVLRAGCAGLVDIV